MVNWRYRISLLVINSISHSFAANVRYRVEHSTRNSKSPRAHVLFSIYYVKFSGIPSGSK